MVKTSLFIATLALAAGYASAECNNMCSGHGICGGNDSCTCYRNWRGNDCSERTCQYGVAFVDTAQGDLDHDGVLGSNANSIILQWAPKSTGGTFESFPDMGAQEAHSYMECSNKGLCDRSTGTCVCFDGYEGSSCHRTVCPNDCSGHGICRNINDRTNSLANNAKVDYPLWDGSKNQACICDPGYTDVDCSKRSCPKGSDPLDIENTSNQPRVNEVQQIKFESGDGSDALTGQFALRYEDLFGETWTTSTIVFTSTYNTLETNIADALKAIPNSVIEGVSTSQDATGITNGINILVTFTHNHGALNMLEYTANTLQLTTALTAKNPVITRTTPGTFIASECSNRGLCDFETGLCKCFRGYRLDDCSSQHALAFGSTTATV